MKKYMIKLNNKVYKVEMEEIIESTKKVAATTTQSNRPSKSNNSAQSLGAATVKAPMAADILDICVKVGDQVKKDQTLVKLEVMKMENEISSPVDGKIASIGISKGDSVNAGDILLQIQ
jgi:biotin carboxyl carrier protein